MSVYAISFRVDYDSSYQSRYDSLTAAIRAQATVKYWDETTSFFLLTSDSQPGALADAIIAASTFSAAKDLLVVLYLSGDKGHAIRGKYADKDIIEILKLR